MCMCGVLLAQLRRIRAGQGHMRGCAMNARDLPGADGPAGWLGRYDRIESGGKGYKVD